MIGFSIFVDPSGLKIPTTDFESLKDPGETTANIFVHLILDIGTFIGVLPFPVLAIYGAKITPGQVELLLTYASYVYRHSKKGYIVHSLFSL